jgi:5-histidylcysteine sulfoxide synthase
MQQPNKSLMLRTNKMRVVEAPWTQNLRRSRMTCSLASAGRWWTGMSPTECPGYHNGALHSLEIPRMHSASRSSVRAYFNNTWTLTELLFSALKDDEAFYRPPYHGLRHPMIFYYGHPAVLYINKLVLAGLLPEGINPYFEDIFQTGVDEMSWDDMSKNQMLWPTIDEVHQYRKDAYKAILTVIDNHPDLGSNSSGLNSAHPLWALFMGFEHERIHLETSSVLIRELPLRLVRKPSHWPQFMSVQRPTHPSNPIAGEHYPNNSMEPISATGVAVGKPLAVDTFGWDNEYGSRELQVAAFEASRYLVCNGEYFRFIIDGGYRKQSYWSEDGWNWRSFRDIQYPTFWVVSSKNGALEYKLRTCFEVIEMRWEYPVIVNYFEAKAFCAWKSIVDNRDYRLPSEAEHNAMRKYNLVDSNDISKQRHNSNLRWGGECPVDIDQGLEAGPVHDVFGNVWQWCEDHFNPLEGASPHPLYEDFSTPCYDGQHQMIMGGSFVSTGDEATPHARFHFRPHFFQHAGIRLIHSPSFSNGKAFKF